jgi:mannobiose 2-epimerase
MAELTEKIKSYKAELTEELENILRYWSDRTPDEQNGGFLGRLDNDSQVIAEAPKGSVLNARILWTFSAAFNQAPNAGYLKMAYRAYDYICQYLIDQEFGGVYWSVDFDRHPLDTKKQVYAIAFTSYAFSEFYIASGDEAAKQKAIDLFYLLVEKAYDPLGTGYFEAFTRNWQSIGDLRLSAKDANEKKTMNTHLHVLEAYSNLYRIWPDKALKQHVEVLLDNFFEHFIDHQTNHLALFFDEDWNSKSGLVSYGHDIEATWLLLEAADVIGDEESGEKLRELSIKMADETIKAVDADGGLWYEYEPAEERLVKEKHWWVQAEAMVGFFNAWQISGDQKYFDHSLAGWEFVKKKILDKANGEWFWGISADGKVMQTEDKVGIWKCPYHNSRACLEIIRRIG